MSSKDTQFSLDKSETLSVGTEEINCPLGKVNINDIEIGIVEDLNDKYVPVHFWPVMEEDRKLAAMKLNLAITSNTHPVRQSGIREIITKYPPISTKDSGNGAYLSNSFSILLTGRDMYSAIIRHVTCNYIENPIEF